MIDLLIPLVFGYAIGSLPIGFLIARRARGIDLRRAGSGNVGATNVYRTAGLATALLVMLVDAGKGVASVALAWRLEMPPSAVVTAGVGAIVGHIYPVWLRFRGGKGVATALGTFGAMAPAATALALAVFAATVWRSRYVSLGSVAAAVMLAPLAWLLGAPPAVVAGALVAAILIVNRHRANLVRVRQGVERRLGA